MSLQKQKTSDNPLIKNTIKLILIASVSISGSLSLCTLLPFFWQLPFWASILIFIFGCLLFFFPVKKLTSILFRTLKKGKPEFINLSLNLIFVLLLTAGFAIPNLDQIIHLPPVTLNISLVSESSQSDDMHLQGPKVEQNSRELFNNSQDCNLINNEITLSENQNCQLSYTVDVSRPSEVLIKLKTSSQSINASVNIRHMNETISLSDQNQNNIEWKTDVNQSFSPKKIRYPLWALSIYFSITFLFLCLYALSQTNFSLKKNSSTKSPKWPGRIFIYGSFILISFLYTAGRIGSNPWHFVDLYSDAANIASFAAAYAHPENFASDAFLSNPGNFQNYFALHVPLIRGLGNLFGNYSTAFVVLLFPTLLLTLTGYFLLGNTLFKNRWISFIFSIIIILPISFPVYEYYGASVDILPRSLFQALLPFALILLLRFIDRPEKWWICSIAFLLLFYVHPVSGPSWFIALYLSYLLIMLVHFRKILWKPFFLSLAIIILGLIPFVNAFFVASDTEPLDIPLIKQILEYRLTVQTVSVYELYKNYLTSYVLPNTSMAFLWLVSIIFLLTTAFFLIRQIPKNKNQTAGKTNDFSSFIIFTWWAAILFASIIIPLLDEIYISATGNLPMLREIRRNLRYFLPLLWITFFYIVTKIIIWNGASSETPVKKSINRNMFLLCVGLTAVYFYQEFPINNIIFQNTKNCLQQGKLVCELPGNSMQKVDFYDHVCDIVQPDELIFPDPSPAYLGDSLIPRYYCQRSIAYTYKDGSGAGNSSMSFIKDWWSLAMEMETVLPTNETPLNLDVLRIAQSENADYIILINPDPANLRELNRDQIVFQNNYGLLYEIP